MWWYLFLEQVHFALNILGALILFGATWLYFDAWLARRSGKELTRTIGFLFFSVSFVLHATSIETTLLSTPLLAPALMGQLYDIARTVGYGLILISLWLDPIQPRPKSASSTRAAAIMPFAFAGGLAAWLLPGSHVVLAVLIAITYIYHATVGLERHLLPVGLSFAVIALSEIVALGSLLRDTTNVALFGLVAPFGLVWMMHHGLVFMGILLLRGWVYGYLLKRFETQLFMVFTTSIVLIYLATAVTFTSLLLKNVQEEALKQLTTDVKVLSYAIDSKKAEILSDAGVLGANPEVLKGVTSQSLTPAREMIEQYLVSKKLSSLVVVDGNGQVLARGEDRDRYGDSLGGDGLVRRALTGVTVSSLASRDGVVAPELLVRSASPILTEGKTVGVVVASVVIDSAFADGIKKATELESTMYVGNRITATTLTASDGTTRPIGLALENPDIRKRVLGKGVAYSGSVQLLGIPHLGAYLPLRDVDNEVIGMLFAGRSQETILAASGRSFEITFLVVVCLLVFSVIPAYLVSQSIVRQIR